MRAMLALFATLFFFHSTDACAAAALFLEEPFGTFGHMNPTGHAAVYLSRVCAASPTRLRRCESGETGVVISRYHRVGGYDWIAIPLIPYLYAVERPEQVPAYAGAELVERLRDACRRRHLLQLAPNRPDGSTPQGEWIQLIGAAYERKIYSLEIQTTAAQDDRLIAKLNAQANKSRFNLLFRNCADFARGVINTYDPHAIHRRWFADLGITTPQQAAKSLAAYSRHHPDLRFSCFMIAQVPGSLPRSRAVRGVLESFLRSKKYVLPVAALHPLIAGGMAMAYVVWAHCDKGRHFTRQLDSMSQPAAVVAELQGIPSRADRQRPDCAASNCAAAARTAS
jgi:hypothetical protein